MSASDFPNTVSILGRDIEIRECQAYLEAAGDDGQWDAPLGLIRLQSVSDTRNEEWMYYVLGHELAHALTDMIGRPDLSKDEEFVDMLGAGIIQIARTLGREEEET